jgi:hypothetical protein
MDVLLKLLPFLPQQILALIQAIAALRKTGVDPADVEALVKSLLAGIQAENAETLALLDGIPLPTPK